MFESLESRQLFSATPILTYPAPAAVVSDALSIINATPAQVVANAADNVASGAAPTQAMLDLIEYHEGYSLSIYPDASGVPTLGIGLKLTGGNSTTAESALEEAGVNFSDLVQDWGSIKSLWVSQHHPLSALKDTSPLWAKFVAQNPSVADPVLTSAQATTAFSDAVAGKIAAASAFFQSYDQVFTAEPDFSLLDRDPQIAIVDLAYHVDDFDKYKSLVVQLATGGVLGGVYGNVNVTSNFNSAAKQFHSSALGSVNGARDDQELLLHGDDFRAFPPLQTTIVTYQRQVGAIAYDPENAFGQNIIVPDRDLSFTSSDPRAVKTSVNSSILSILSYVGLRTGTFQITLSVPRLSLSETTMVMIAPRPVATWDAEGTKPNVNGKRSISGELLYNDDQGVVAGPYFGFDGTFRVPNGPAKAFSVELINNFPPYVFQVHVGQYGPDDNVDTIALGADVWTSGTVTITMLVGDYVAGTFSAGPDDSSGQPGTISGSFAGYMNTDMRDGLI